MDRFWGLFSSRPDYTRPKKEGVKEPLNMKKQWAKFAVVLALYLLFLLWLRSWLGLIVVPFIFDVYITKKIKWQWWREKENPVRTIMSWVDAIVFALVAVYFINQFFFQNYVIPSSSLEKSLLTGDYLFVSKVSYGPRIPETPLTMPLTQHTMPELFGVRMKSYIEWPHWEYRRVSGLGKVEQNDIVVFNYPAGDTICTALPYETRYYELCYAKGYEQYALSHAGQLAEPDSMTALERRAYFATIYNLGKKFLNEHSEEFGQIATRPTDRRENYVKRCVGLPGQTLQIINQIVYIDGQQAKTPDNAQVTYVVKLNNYSVYDLLSPQMDDLLRELQITKEDISQLGYMGAMPLTRHAAVELVRRGVAESVQPVTDEMLVGMGMDRDIYPQNGNFHWTRDNYGPIWIPVKGATIDLTLDNLPIYERPIRTYEKNSLEVRDGRIFINGEETTKYTFRLDYYWMMGDNRHNSADSRYWGFVPEDHIVGKPIFIWWSSDPDRSGFSGIRWNRLFNMVDNIK